MTRHPELFGDLFGGAAVGHRLQDLELARRESFDPTLQVAIPLGTGTLFAQDPVHLGGLVQRLALERAADGGRDVLDGGGLRQHPARAGLDRSGQHGVVAVTGEDHDRGAAALRPDPARRFEAVGPGHPEVHEDHVGFFLERGRDGKVAVTHDLDDIEVLFAIECDLHRFTEGTVVVGDDDRDRINVGPSHGTGDGRPGKSGTP